MNISTVFRPALLSIGFGLVSIAASAGPTLSVSESVLLNQKPDAVWKATGSFAGIGDWYPGITRVELSQGKNNQKGAVRVITLKDGATITEELLDFNAGEKTLRYRITASPLPVKNYVSTYQVKKSAQGTEVIWGSTFEQDPAAQLDADKTRELISGIYKNGFSALKEKLNKAKD